MLATDYFAAFAVVISAIGLFFSLRSVPTRVRKLLEATLKDVRRVEEEVAGLRAVWASYREAIDSVLEEITSTEERVERNRKRVDQRARRAEKKAEGNGQDDDPTMTLLHAARNVGMPV